MDYEIKIREDKKRHKTFIFRAGDTDIGEFRNENLYKLFQKYNTTILEEQRKAEEIIENSTFSSVNSINVEGTMFNAAYGADQTKTGHGIYAEEAGARLDILAGEKSTVVGRDNAKNGPDKIVDTAPVQCKYCKTAYSSIESCFRKDSSGAKSFRYFDLNGNPMKIEVPADQYAQAIDYMKKSIRNGQVPGVTDPNAAYDIIRKGRLSYNQALNLAKAGTVESIAFDAATGAITCLSALGISSIVTFAQVYWTTKDYKKAAKYAIITGLQVYGLSFAGGIIASQISRTAVVNSVKPFAASLVNSMNPKTVQGIMNAFRALAGKKAIYGAAAQKSFARFLGSNAITEGVFFLVFSIPDLYRLCSGKISGAQYTKNMFSLLGSFVGSIGASMATGSLLGKKGGEKINKKAGAAIGFVGGAVGGFLVGTVTKAVGNFIKEDDAVISGRMFNAILTNLLIEYMLSDNEQDQLIENLNSDEKAIKTLQQDLLKSKSQGKAIEDFLRPRFDTVIKSRERVSGEEEKNMFENINILLLNGELAYGV